jgi:hypothetical protein
MCSPPRGGGRQPMAAPPRSSYVGGTTIGPTSTKLPPVIFPHQSVCLTAWLSFCLPVRLSVCVSLYLPSSGCLPPMCSPPRGGGRQPMAAPPRSSYVDGNHHWADEHEAPAFHFSPAVFLAQTFHLPPSVCLPGSPTVRLVRVL